jgi:integrase
MSQPPRSAAHHSQPRACTRTCSDTAARCRCCQARVDGTVIALWLGHADTGSTQQYIHADMTIKERALALLTPPTAAPGRYRPTDEVLAYLDSLG